MIHRGGLMRRTRTLCLGLLVALLSRTGVALEPRAQVSVWDTGRAFQGAISAETLAAKTGWTLIGPGREASSFEGDAVVANGKILAVFRKEGAAIEVHSGSESALLRFRAILQATDGNAAHLVRLSLTENGKGRVCVEASYQTAHGTGI